MGMREWSSFKLSELMQIIGGGTPKTNVAEYWGGDIPWLSVKDFNSGFRTVYHTEKSITELGLKNSSAKLLNKGDLIISARGTVGEIAQLGYPMAFNQSCYGLRANNKTINDYLYYLIKNEIDSIKSKTHGSVFDTITRKTFDILEVTIPNNIKEQQAIAHILSTLDEKIEVNNQINQKLEEMAQAIFKHWFVDFEFPNENGEPYKSSGGEMVESELGMIPKGWEVGTLGDVTSLIIDHRGKTPKKLGGDWSEDGYKAISAKNIKNNRIVKREDIRFISKELYEIWMKDPLDAGDIIMTSEAPLGELCYLATKENYCLSQRLFGIRANKELIFPSVLFMYLNSVQVKENITNRATGTTVLGIRQSELRKVPILIPTINLQKEISKFIDYCLKKIYINEKENEILINTRNTLLPKLISGELRVPLNEEKS